MGKRSYQPKNKQETTLLVVLGLIFIGFVISNLVPLLVVAAIGWGVYQLLTQKSRRQKALAHQQAQQLTTKLEQSGRELQKLGQLLDRQDYVRFEQTAKKLLQRLDSYSYLAYSLQARIEAQEFSRISQQISHQSGAIKQELKKLQISPESQPAQSEEEVIVRMAPEIISTYRSIQMDHKLILKKLKEAENPSELEALHEMNMKRFRDILDGYLKIKEAPKDYYKAQERLDQAKAALEQFDLDLDETLRRINESQLKDFEISLRMMNARQQDEKYFSDHSDHSDSDNY